MTKRRVRLHPQLPSGRWQAAYSAPNGKRILAPKTFAKQADAEAWLTDRRREIDRGLWNPSASDVKLTLRCLRRPLAGQQGSQARTREGYDRSSVITWFPRSGRCNCPQSPRPTCATGTPSCCSASRPRGRAPTR